ncbi:(d)CMP kinase [Maritalea mediterranea]|uniref:Cytidylate kinase n=1 Tax=Maritalea mediterranea TaxID=2909667 RepID=A0ABS9E2W9_9HYPH|nr:(d)CMP kinase [Maritalea mediterranea]MCF4097212.1 (d)CMP kinase [Maritalea mediterranea]
MIIAIDGPAASGKGTISKKLAAHFQLPHMDTGLLYRAVGYAMRDDLDLPNWEQVAIEKAQTLDLAQYDENDLTTAEAGIAASKVARVPEVRAALKQVQIKFAQQPGGAILDGRDIGTRICPDAEVKLYITADAPTRAERRTKQLNERGVNVHFDEILAQIEKRDADDKDNPAGAFFVAADAHLLDTTKLSIEAAFQAALQLVDGVLAQKKSSS